MIYIYLLPLGPPSHPLPPPPSRHLGYHRGPNWDPWIIYSRFPLVICFTCGSAHTSTQSPSSTHSLPSPRVYPFVLYICVYSCPAHRFIWTMFLDSMYLCYYICFSLSDLLHSVWQTLGSSVSLQMTQYCSFLWLSNILLYICTTSS